MAKKSLDQQQAEYWKKGFWQRPLTSPKSGWNDPLRKLGFGLIGAGAGGAIGAGAALAGRTAPAVLGGAKAALAGAGLGAALGGASKGGGGQAPAQSGPDPVSLVAQGFVSAGLDPQSAQDAAHAWVLSQDPDPAKAFAGKLKLAPYQQRIMQRQSTQQAGYSPQDLQQMASMRAAADRTAFEQMAKLQDSWGAQIAQRAPDFAKNIVGDGGGLGNLSRQLSGLQQSYDYGMPERVMADIIAKNQQTTNPYETLFGGGIPNSLNIAKLPGT